MGLSGRKRKDLTMDGITGSAVIRSLESADFWDEHAREPDDGVRLTDLGVGRFTFRLELEVQLDDGRAPYTVTDKFKVPIKAGYGTREGATLPIWADPADQEQVEINWDRFLAEGKPGETRALTRDEQRAEVHRNMPDGSRKQMVDSWVQAAGRGQMTRDACDEALDGAVDGGLLTADEADATRAALG